MARIASEQTVAIRNLLNEKEGDITHKDALPLLATLGYPDVDSPTFNGIKALWKKARRQEEAEQPKRRKRGRPPLAPKPVIEGAEALALVREYNGVPAAEAFALKLLAAVGIAKATIAELSGVK